MVQKSRSVLADLAVHGLSGDDEEQLVDRAHDKERTQHGQSELNDICDLGATRAVEAAEFLLLVWHQDVDIVFPDASDF